MKLEEEPDQELDSRRSSFVAMMKKDQIVFNPPGRAALSLLYALLLLIRIVISLTFIILHNVNIRSCKGKLTIIRFPSLGDKNEKKADSVGGVVWCVVSH